MARKRLFRGTRLCKFFLAGCCSRGDACNFAHSTDDLQDLPDFSKTRLCDPFMRSGVCEQGYDCKFAHSQDELRPSYISKSKGQNRPQDRPRKESQAQAASDQPERGPHRQGIAPQTQAGLLHSAALYSLILQGLNVPGPSASASQTPHVAPRSVPDVPDSPVQTGRVVSSSPKADKHSAPCWSRQTTADAVDDSVRNFSRQTTEEPQNAWFRQITDESRRPLPLSQLLSLPEPEEPSDSQETAGMDPQEATQISHGDGAMGYASEDGDSDGQELQVRFKNTFLHWEPVPGPDHAIPLKRSRSLPIPLADGASVDLRSGPGR